MKEAESIVFIIDDDPLYRASTERLVRSVGFRVQSFESARDFVDSRRPNVPSCLILEVRLPGLSMRKMQAKSLAELVLMAEALGIASREL
jgi:FixJ family two-component response regulator